MIFNVRIACDALDHQESMVNVEDNWYDWEQTEIGMYQLNYMQLGTPVLPCRRSAC